jgi:hypothetical protein
MKIIIVLLLSISFQVFANADSETESTDFESIRKILPLPQNYANKDLFEKANKLKPLVENYINNYPQSKNLLEIQKQIQASSSAYSKQVFKDRDNKVYKSIDEMQKALERYGSRTILDLSGKLNMASLLLKASYTHNPKKIRCAVGTNVAIFCSDTSEFSKLGFENMAIAYSVAAQMARESSNAKKTFLNDSEKLEICIKTLKISPEKGIELIKRNKKECPQ